LIDSGPSFEHGAAFPAHLKALSTFHIQLNATPVADHSIKGEEWSWKEYGLGVTTEIQKVVGTACSQPCTRWSSLTAHHFWSHPGTPGLCLPIGLPATYQQAGEVKADAVLSYYMEVYSTKMNSLMTEKKKKMQASFTLFGQHEAVSWRRELCSVLPFRFPNSISLIR